MLSSSSPAGPLPKRQSLARYRLLIVDDCEAWRRSIRSMVSWRPELQVIYEACDGLEAVQKAQELRPDLILLDIGLPRLNGIEAARRIRAVSPTSKILFVSENRCFDVAEGALSTGGGGYVVKSEAARELLPALRAVLEGKRFVSASLSSHDLGSLVTDFGALQQESSSMGAHHKLPAPTLTAQECRERIASALAQVINARALCETACDLRQYNAELRERLREHSAVPRPAGRKPLLGGSQPVLPLIGVTFDGMRKAREESKTIRTRGSELRKEAARLRSLARKTRRDSQPAQSA